MKKHNSLYSAFVTVIIPVYNDQSGIDACIQSLDQQSWPKDCYEIIVVDNKSDTPIKIESSYKSNVRLVTCSIPGAYAARNAGIAEAQGGVLAFTDADCLPNPDWINAGVEALKRSNWSCIIGGEVELTLSQDPTAVELYQYIVGFMQHENIKQRGFSATANLFVTRRSVEIIGNFYDKLLSGGDREWCWRAEKYGIPTKFAPEVKVISFARKSLGSAIRQARRVAGGRYKLQSVRADHIRNEVIRPHRTGFSALKWILSHSDMTTWNKIRVLCVATILRLVRLVENYRLSWGAKAERQ